MRVCSGTFERGDVLTAATGKPFVTVRAVGVRAAVSTLENAWPGT